MSPNMNLAKQPADASGAPVPIRPSRVRSRIVLVAVLAAAMGLSACGGGGDVYIPTPTFDVAVVVAGQPVSGVSIASGTRQSVTISAGQSIELNANEPVVWSLDVGGSTVTGTGTTVYYGGAAITQTAVSDARIVVDSSAAYALAVPVSITFYATSTIDSALVATVDVLITN